MKRLLFLYALICTTSLSYSQVVGNGVTITNYDIVGSNLDFNPTTVGTTATYDFLVTNLVGVTQSVFLNGVAAPFSLSETEITLEPNSIEVITLSFSPTEVGNFSNQLLFAGSIFGSGELNISGEGTQIDILTSSNFVQFDNTAIGSTAESSIEISNVGSGTMLISSFEFSDSQYTISETELTILEGESYILDITFTPVFAGGSNETLTINSNDPDEPAFVIDLIATGISEVEGELCGTWSLINSPYTMTGDVTIPDNCSLTIEAGVIINGNDYSILAEGPVNSLGTADQRVVWNDVDLDMTLDEAETSTLNYSDMEGVDINCLGSLIPFDFNWDDEEGHNEFEEWIHGGSGGMNNDGSRLRGYYTGGATYYGTYLYSPEQSYQGQLTDLSFNRQIDDYNTSGNGNEYVRLEVNIDAQGWETIDQYYYMGDQPEELVSYNLESYTANSKVQFRFYVYYYYGFQMWIDNFEMYVGIDEDRLVTINSEGLTIESDFIMDGEFCDMNASQLRTYYTDWDQDRSSYNIDNWIIEGHSEKDEGAYFIGDYNEYTFSNISLDNEDENNEQGLDFNDIDYSSFSFENCSFNGFDYGLYIHSSDYSTFNLTECEALNNAAYGFQFTSITYSDFEISGMESRDNTSYGFHLSGSYNSTNMIYSIFADNGNDGFHYPSTTSTTENDSLVVKNCGFFRNTGDGLETATQAVIEHVTVLDNGSYGIYFRGVWANATQTLISSNLWGNGANASWDQVYVTSNFLNVSHSNVMGGIDGFNCANCDYDDSFTSDQPEFADNEGHMIDYSPGVDGGRPWQIDAHMPMGLGGVRADMGMYGGPNNAYWGGDVISDGTSSLNEVVDIPQDQGNMVGLTFSSSFWDNSTAIDPVTHYTVWRHLDASGSGISLIEEGNWELIGESPAQGFDSYGYQAPTLGNTNQFGTFNSCYTIIAQTDLDQLYWQSNVLCGESSDNLAPAEPEVIAGMVEPMLAEVAWFAPEEEDYAYTEISSDHGFTAEISGDTLTLDATVLEGEDYTYYVRHFDNNGNGSPITEVTLGSEVLLDNVTLHAGWNLISLDRAPYDNSPLSTFSSLLEGNLQYVTGFNNGAMMYDPNGLAFLNTLNTIEGGAGYWVKVTEDDVLRVEGSILSEDYTETLNEGWNLTGFVSQDARDIEIVYGNLIAEGTLEYVTAFDQGVTTFNPFGLPFLNTLTQLRNGFGYWVKTSIDAGMTETNTKSLSPNHDFINGITHAYLTGSTIDVMTTNNAIVATLEVLEGGHIMTTPIYGSDISTEATDGILEGADLFFSLNGVKSNNAIKFDGARAMHKVALEFEVDHVVIFPNPASDLVSIMANDFAPTLIEVRDALGRIILSKNWSHETNINVSNWDTGIYNIELSNEKGDVESHSLVVTH